MKSNERLPAHIAIIMDGNGRWALRRNKPRTHGHQEGVQAIERIAKDVFSRGIEHLTLYAFSTENWKRPEGEVNELMSMMQKFLKSNIKMLLKNSIKLKVYGSSNGLSENLLKDIKRAELRTKDCTKGTLGICFNYGSRDEIVSAVNEVIKSNVDSVNEATFKEYLYTSNAPDPDIIIRTGGDRRLSNFLMYQCAYSELYFIDTLWPDFDTVELDKILDVYKNTDRRFGNIGK